MRRSEEVRPPCPSCGRPMNVIRIAAPLQNPPARIILECRPCGLKMSPLADEEPRAKAAPTILPAQKNASR